MGCCLVYSGSCCVVWDPAWAFRFGMKSLSPSLQTAHTTASLMAGSIGISLLAGHYHHHQYSHPSLTNLHLLLSCLALPVLLAGGEQTKELCVKAVAGVSTVSLLAGGIVTGQVYPMVGAGLIVAAAPMDRPGSVGLPYVDYFHYILSAANLALLQGMLL